MYDHDLALDLQRAVEQVEEAVRESSQGIEAAIRENRSSPMLSWIWPALIGYFLVTAAGNMLHTKVRYSVQYDIPISRVQIEKKPHDCDFLTAPLGEKYCHYEISVSTVRWATSTAGLPISSLDGGKTWTVFTPDQHTEVPKYSKVEQVYVSWEKSED